MNDHQPLFRALRLNAFFSTFSAVILLLAGGWIAAQLGLSAPWPVYVTGVILLLFAAQLFAIVRTRRVRLAEVAGIIAADIAWVAGTAIAIIIYGEAMTAAGVLLLDVVAVAVLAFAVLQFRGLVAYRRQGQKAT